jgi:hypothetical protein
VLAKEMALTKLAIILGKISSEQTSAQKIPN